jgi:rhodanese-related sulfurtransferase
MSEPTGAHDLEPDQVADLHGRGEVQLIDVREPHEHSAGRIAGARHIELSQLSSAAATIDRDRPVVFYCRSGQRSGLAAEAFRASGFDARNLTGGLLAWVEQRLPLVPEGGSVASH